MINCEQLSIIGKINELRIRSIQCPDDFTYQMNEFFSKHNRGVIFIAVPFNVVRRNYIQHIFSTIRRHFYCPIINRRTNDLDAIIGPTIDLIRTDDNHCIESIRIDSELVFPCSFDYKSTDIFDYNILKFENSFKSEKDESIITEELKTIIDKYGSKNN